MENGVERGEHEESNDGETKTSACEVTEEEITVCMCLFLFEGYRSGYPVDRITPLERSRIEDAGSG